MATVHGTWVNGKKIQPGETVDLKQGDTFTLGVSTRVYHLNWVPLTLSQFNLVQQEQELKVFSFFLFLLNFTYDDDDEGILRIEIVVRDT